MRIKRPRRSPEQRRLHRQLMRAYIILLIGQLAMGSGGIFGRLALNGLGPLQVAATRLTLVSVPLLLRLLWVGHRRVHWRSEVQLMAAGLLLAVNFACWTGSLLRLSVGASTLLTCTSPLWTGLYEAVILRHRMPRSFWLCLALATGSVALMLQDAGYAADAAPKDVLVGVLMGLGCGVGTAGYFIIVRYVSRRHSYTTLDIITRAFSWSALGLIGLCWAFERVPLPPLTQWQPWAAVAGMALVTQACGHTMQNVALKTLRPSVVGIASLLEPLIAAVLAFFLFHEHVTWRLGVGGATLLGALGWALRVAAKNREKQAARSTDAARSAAA